MSELVLFSAGRRPPGIREGEFLLCKACLAVHRISAADRSPFFGGDGHSEPADDLAEFLLAHAGHPLERLVRFGEAEIRSHARHDPMCRVTWEVQDREGRRYVVSFGRDDVESPRRYSIRPGRLCLVSEYLEIDGDLLRSVLDEALFPNAAPEWKLRRLLEACRCEVARLPLERLEPIEEDREDPAALRACLPEGVAEALAAEAAALFSGPEAERLAAVLHGELRHEIPVVRILRHYTVEP